MGEIAERFATNGYRLALTEEDGIWVASFHPVVASETGYVGTYGQPFTGRTKLEAAEAAWAEYEKKQQT